MKRVPVAALVCAIVFLATTTPRAQDQRGLIATKLKQQLGGTFRVNAVQVDGKSLQIVVNDREIFEDDYRMLLTTTCTDLGADAKQFTEIAFGNRFADQGYVFGAPAKCAALVKMPPDRQKDAIFADTHEL